jgi:hypothetical protein
MLDMLFNQGDPDVVRPSAQSLSLTPSKSLEPALMHIIKSTVLQKLCMRHQMFVKSSLSKKDKQVQEKDSTIIYPHSHAMPSSIFPTHPLITCLHDQGGDEGNHGP